ncbi:MAG: site-specific integrase [Solirubrobacterales bacterium]|nr:site-specific integrase [Solirubrobacterales bacterium]
MYLMGHTDAKFTMSVYQQVMDVDDDAIDALEDLIGCDLDAALALLCGRERRGSRSRLREGSDIDRTRNTLSAMDRRPA